MDKIYFKGKFEVINNKFLKIIEKLKKNSDKEVIFLFYESNLIPFEDRKRLLEQHLLGLKYQIWEGDKLQTNEERTKVLNEKSMCCLKNVKFNKLRAVDVPLNYVKYILDHHYFIYDKIYNLMSEERYKHTVSVALTAIDIAKSNGMCPNKAFIASMLHDIAKDTDKYVVNQIMLKRFKKHIFEEKVVYHQFVGTIFARKLFKIYNMDILKSIKYHTTGFKNMSDCAKIVYCADKIEPTRGYDSKFMIDACKKDINSGFELVLYENIKFLKSKNVNLDGLAQEAINFYKIKTN